MTELDPKALKAAIETENLDIGWPEQVERVITAYLATRREQGYEERRVDVAGAIRAISPEDLAEAIKAAGAVKWDRLA